MNHHHRCLPVPLMTRCSPWFSKNSTVEPNEPLCRLDAKHLHFRPVRACHYTFVAVVIFFIRLCYGEIHHALMFDSWLEYVGLLVVLQRRRPLLLSSYHRLGSTNRSFRRRKLELLCSGGRRLGQLMLVFEVVSAMMQMAMAVSETTTSS